MHLPKPGEGGDFTPPPEGTWPAVCYRLIDLGTQLTSFKGEDKLQHKVMISWELHDEETRMADGQPMTIHQRYTWSMHEKATLRKHLEAWRGAKFKDSEFGPGGFDPKNLIGKSCLVNIVHEVKPDGKTFANIMSVSKVPNGMAVGKLINPPVFFSLSDFDQEAFDSLPDGIKKTIQKSPEYGQLMHKSGRQYADQMPADNDRERWGPERDGVPF